ncbi:MAG TPA: ethylbenzene dehydrogenase-related protein [Methylomirabilota bacterium]|nr:ethylbenzene dehydrogenase-related protein [Methylomirabilota bacterium]
MASPVRRAIGWATIVVLLGCSGSPASRPIAPVRVQHAGATASAQPPTPPAAPGEPVPVRLTPSTTRAATPELLAVGKQVYDKQCAACHGPDGRGEGEAAYLLYPKPRDFTGGAYRLVSTWERVPTDEDLFRTISRGMPGSSMPSWGHLSEEERWGLVHYVKTFARTPIAVRPASDPRGEGQSGTGVITVPPPAPFTPEARQLALERFADACASCHGSRGKGDGTEEQKDDLGYPTRPRDLTVGVFKGDPDPVQLYRRIVAGLPGTPMPMSDWAYGADAWHLVNLILSWSSPEQRARAEMRRFRIVARRVDRVPDHPDAGAWRVAQPVNLHLMPLWWRSDRPEEITVRALHDGRQLALLLVWADATHDHTAMRPQDFRDAVAVQLSPTPEPPFFAMGSTGQFVNIWMWKSERQADLEPAFQELEKVYPNLGIDSYPDPSVSPVEQPTRHALTLGSDRDFITGWGAGNIVSDPSRASPAEDLVAQGFGTLRARPRPDQAVHARGVYATGAYRVMLRRDVVGRGERAVTLTPGTTLSVGFAVWNGSAGDRDGKKSVTIWQDLVLAP